MIRKITIKEYNQGQQVLFPNRMDAYIAPDAPVRQLNSIVDQLELSAVMESYLGGGSRCYGPRVTQSLGLLEVP